jgi:hypothetical protein
VKRSRPLTAMPKPAPREVVPGYLAWLHETQPCLLWNHTPLTCGGFLDVGRQRFAIHAHHTKSRGARGSDQSCVPLCEKHHWEGHHNGWKTFAAKYGVDLAAEAKRLYQRYQREVGS